MNNNTPTPKKIMPEGIVQCKQEILQDIRNQRQAMTGTTRRIFAPPTPAALSGSSPMRSLNTGMAIFDSVMLGMKMIREIRGLLWRRY